MATIVTRESGASPKGAPLTNAEIDSNFINLNQELSTKIASVDITAPLVRGGTATAPVLSLPASTTGANGYMSAAQAAKLDGLTNYTHPSTHPPAVIAQDASNRFVSDVEKTAWNAKQEALVSGANIKTVNGQSLLGSGNIDSKISVVEYDNRGSLRALLPSIDAQIIVKDLGLFLWVSGSLLLDDDETCFATSSGRWVLTGAAPELAYAALLAELDELFELVNPAALDGIKAKFLRGSFSMSLTSLATATSSSFTATVAGAVAGDSVIVNSGNSFGTSAADMGRLSYVAYVSSANTVTVTVRNASAATASMTASTWGVLVIKQ